MKANLKWQLAALVTMIFILSGCLKSDDPVIATPKAYLSILHLAPTAPSLDVFFDNTRVSSAPFTPGSVTAGYNAVDKGAFAVRFKKVGSDSLVAESPISQYDSLSFYTLIIYNTQADGPAIVHRIKDDFAGLESSKPYYRFFHGSPNTGSIDLYMDNVKIESGRSHADNTSFDLLNKFSGTSGGVHQLQVKAAGTDTVLTTLNVDLLIGSAYTFYLKGLEGGSGNSQLKLESLRAN